MATRGFVAIWYSGYGLHRPNPNASTVATWKGMVSAALRAWRAHHPDDRLMLLDLDHQFSSVEKDHLCNLGIENGHLHCPDPDDPVWTRTYLDKAVAMRFAPFDEVCLFDLDVLFLANVSRVFDIVDRVGLIGYPYYKRRRNRINACLWVVKDRNIWPDFWDAVDHVRGVAPYSDEAALDLCIDRGDFPVTKLSPTYAMDPFCWLMREGLRRHSRGQCDVQEIRPPDPGKFSTCEGLMGNWHMGDKVIRAIHMSGAKERIMQSPLWRQYMAAVTSELVKRYGGAFPLCCE